MHIEFLVEELSAEPVILNIVSRVLGQNITFAVHPHQGKLDLFKKLPDRLKGYKAWLPEDWRIVVLVDADDEDCVNLKAKLEQIAKNAGFLTKSAATNSSSCQVLNRLAIEELEAWFFGDVTALHTAYHRVSLNLGRKARYRDPDAIIGGTWEALERELKRVGCFPGGLAKITAAREISSHMDPERNKSRSFQVFKEGLLELVG